MSFSNSFQSPNDFCAHLKKVIFSERNVEGNKPRQLSQRYSLDILEDTIVQRKMTEDKSFILIREEHVTNDDKENNMDQTNDNTENNMDQAKLQNIAEQSFKTDVDSFAEMGNSFNGTFMKENPGNKLQWDSDDSFEVMERMCNKTSSDPNSTLFQYLHSEDRVKFVAKAKESLQSNSFDAEVDALQRMLDDLREQDIKILDENLLKNNEITQLEDIEAPSRIWENTFTGDTSLQTSPIKMIGLLRPSTIIEEFPENDVSTCSSQTSFQSVSQTAAHSEISSYETAQESIINTTKSQVTDAVAILQQKKTADFSNNLNNVLDNIKDNITMNAPTPSLCYETRKREQIYVNPEVDDVVESDESIIEIFSDEDADSSYDAVNQIGTKTSEQIQDTEAEVEIISVINAPFDSAEDSLHFNDTLEEVEYMLLKGMEYIGTEKKSSKINTSFLPEKSKQTVLNEKDSPFVKPKPVHRFDIDISSSVHKLDIFNNVGSKPKNKQIWNKKFLHVVSPVGAYMNKTPTTPLMASAKIDNEQCSNSNYKVFRELEYESRLCQPKCSQNCYDLPVVRSPIPKKAYISSELKQVTDVRTPVKIPGGKKIQKYLEKAVLPAVVRHEGKIKFQNENSGSSSHIPQRKETSFADLSVASGDVSLYTIMDAKKF